MPPQATGSFVGVPRKLAKSTPPTTPPSEDAELQSISKRSSWNSARISSSKIMPKEPSPKKASAEKSKKSKSGETTPTKEPLKSCLKKASDGNASPLSNRSECTQMSMRSEFTDSVFENSGSLKGVHYESPKDGLELVHQQLEIETKWSHEDENAEQLQGLNTTPTAVPRSSPRGFPVAFIEAFARDEESVADSPYMGPYLLKLAKFFDSVDNTTKALEYCTRAVKFYERHTQQECVLDLVLSLHILATLHCHLKQYDCATAQLERSLTLSDLEGGREEHALAAFSGHMQLGDTLYMVGKLSSSLQHYHRALVIQKSNLGEFDPRVAETCIYVAEAHIQALEFAEAKELCEHSLLIHTKHCNPGTVEEATDHRLLAIILSAQGEHSKALESLIYANDIFVKFDHELDVATGNQSIGDELVALGRDSEAFECYGKCVNDFRMLQGEQSALVASTYTSLADLYMQTNKPKEAKVHCQLALQIFAKQEVGHTPDDVAYGLVNIASILEQLNEKETALILLQRAYNIQDKIPGQQATVAGLGVQIGILQNMLHQFKPALESFQSALTKMKTGTLGNSPLIGLVMNQMAITSIELGDIPQAAQFFEDAKAVMDITAGPQHLDTLDVWSNLACTYISLGRSEEARELLEEVVRVKEEKLGAVHPDVREDRVRLQASLVELGQSTTYKRSRKLVEMLTSARKAFHSTK